MKEEAVVAKIPIDKAYDSPPLWYDLRGLCILWLTYKSSLHKQIRFFSNFRWRDRHLEVAIGSGSLFRLIRLMALLRGTFPQKIVGFDYAPSMLGGAMKLFSQNKDIQLEIVDATQLPYANNSFSTVHVANAIHCIPNYKKALMEFHRVLQEGGDLKLNALLPPSGFLRGVATRINAWGIRKGILASPIESSELVETLKAMGFDVYSLEKEGNCLYVQARKN